MHAPPDFAPTLPEVASVACRRCGASLPLTALVPHVVCAHCQERQEVAPDLVARLEAYRGAVAQAVQRVHERLASRDLWSHRGRTNPVRLWALVAFAVLFLVCLLIGLPAAMILARTDVVPYEVSLRWILFPLGGALVVLLGVSIATWAGVGRRRVVPTVPWPEIAVRCSGCGGDNTMSAGQVLAPCRFCAASCVATREKVLHVVDVAARLCRSAALSKHAAQRHVYTPRSNLPLLRRSEEFYQAQRSAAYGTIEAKTMAAGVADLAERLQGQVLDGDALVLWLDRNWPEVHPPVDWYWPHPRWSVGLDIASHPALVEMGSWPLPLERHGRQRQLQPRVSVLLATAEAGELEPPTSEVAALAQAGWTFFQNAAGVGAWRPLAPGALPDAPSVGWVLGLLQQGARTLGLGPPPQALETET